MREALAEKERLYFAECTPVCDGNGLASGRLPFSQGGRAEFVESLAVDEMAFEAEMIADVGVDGGEFP